MVAELLGKGKGKIFCREKARHSINCREKGIQTLGYKINFWDRFGGQAVASLVKEFNQFYIRDLKTTPIARVEHLNSILFWNL